MHEQGYKLKHNILFQDNESAIRMERNGRNLCTGNSRHISICYFFVKDRIDKGEVSVEYCPTYRMLADFFTKPLQGKMFEVYKDVILGKQHISTLEKLMSSSIKERVEKPVSDKKNNTGVIENVDFSKKCEDSVKPKKTYVEAVMGSRNHPMNNGKYQLLKHDNIEEHIDR